VERSSLRFCRAGLGRREAAVVDRSRTGSLAGRGLGIERRSFQSIVGGLVWRLAGLCTRRLASTVLEPQASQTPGVTSLGLASAHWPTVVEGQRLLS
jgi:hypothetical protein